MTDEIIKELWNIKDDIARQHEYNIDKLSTYYLNEQSARQEQRQQS
ncbi:MAG: hypothetical protein AAFO09_07650 [Pseudomonadota bacterium]